MPLRRPAAAVAYSIPKTRTFNIYNLQQWDMDGILTGTERDAYIVEPSMKCFNKNT
jgi:hypothetical protein